MNKRYFIYEVLGWPDGPIVPLTVKVPGMDHAYHVDPIRGYVTEEDAEKQLESQIKDEKLSGIYIILPLYDARRKIGE